MSGWRPALRIARRSVRRTLGRSILIASLVAVPIAGATVMDGLARTFDGPEIEAYQVMGNADGRAEVTDQNTLPDWRPIGGMHPYLAAEDRPPQRDPKSVDLAALLPAGSRLVQVGHSYSVRLVEGDRVVRTELLAQEAVGDPLTDHDGRLVSGRAPHGPDEAVVTESLAERLGLLDDGELRPGSTITAEDGPTVAVTGLVITPRSLNRERVLALPDSGLATAPSTQAYQDVSSPTFQVDLPAGVAGDSLARELTEHGVAFQPREVFTNEMYASQDNPLETGGPIALVVGFGLLEVVLLAGAAFAVGARRQVHDLGLIAANGGTKEHVRRTVLAQGLVLGIVGTAAGFVLGLLVLMLGEPLWEQLGGVLVEDWRFGWIELTAVAAVGVLAGLAAALLPAAGVARMRPVDALAERFRTTALTARLPAAGLILIGVGVAAVIGAGVLAHHDLTAYLAAAEEADGPGFPAYPSLTVPIGVVLLGGSAAIAGLIMITPGLLGVLARLGRWLPLSGRMAVRDAGRHRHRTVPAIAAIMIVVATSVMIIFTVSADAADDVQTMPDNTIILRPDGDLRRALPGDEQTDRILQQLAAGVDDVTAELPGGTAHEMSIVRRPVAEPPGTVTPVVFEAADPDPASCQYGGSHEVSIATPTLLELSLGHKPDAATLAALEQGKVVVSDECVVSAAGTVRTQSTYYNIEGGVGNATEIPIEPVELPAHLATVDERAENYYAMPKAYISPEAAAALGWDSVGTGTVVTYSGTATQDDLDAAYVAAEDAGISYEFESDDTEEINMISLGVGAGAALVTLLGVGITVALSAAEGRADLATLAAVGAQPRRRRTLAGAQSLILAGFGTLLGVALGGCVGAAIVPMTGNVTIMVPWQHLAITVAVVPALAVVVAVLATRSTLPMVRRIS